MGGVKMKATIEMSTEMIVGIVAFLILFIIAILFLFNIISLEKIGKFMGDTCALLLTKVGVLGSQALEVCQIFYLG